MSCLADPRALLIGGRWVCGFSRFQPGFDHHNLLRETESGAASAREFVEVTTPADTETAPESEPERELDVEEAERFAASIRPSWAEAPVVVPSVPPPNALSAAAGSTVRVVRHNTRTDLTTPKVRKRRGASYAILGASLLGVCGVLYLGVASTRLKPGAADTARTDSRSLETRVHAAQRPAAAPVAKVESPAAAAAPLVAAQVEAPAAEHMPAAQVDQVDQAQQAPETVAGEAPPVEPSAAVAEAPHAAEPSAALPPPVLDPVAAAEPAPEAPATPTPEATPTPQPVAPAAAPLALAAPAQTAAAAPAAPAQPAATSTAAPAQPVMAQPAPAPAAQTAAAAPATTAQPAAAAPTPAPQLAAAEPKVEPARAAERPKQVLLSLQAYPPNTRLILDGAQIDNPFRGRLPRASKHRIQAAAPGFAPETHVLRMDADVQLMLSLKRDQVRDVKGDPYRDQRRSAQAEPARNRERDRGAGFVSDNPY